MDRAIDNPVKNNSNKNNNNNSYEKSKNSNYLIGSCNKFRNGYGNGASVSTARNQLTLPITVAPSRYPKSNYSNEIQGSKPSILIDKSNNKRNAEQILYQTSGEYGKFILGFIDDKVLLNMQPLYNNKRP